ncbi:ArnT family glycosyltransferase [Halomicrobium urmianum]|uniref:ArnT family glycosyltransferase n=1 Tax=Halomicrobium urmianum TaxID=1586233 RepID=UPI001CD9D22C|nr:glycosyltransferase family 39 protein [Halomicrobium urmianum]
MRSDRRRLGLLVAVAPVAVLAPVLTIPLPELDHAGVEIASYYQTFALVEDGLASYTYLTPLETGAGVHVYAWLSAPLFAAGVTEAGRVVSLLAAVGSALLVWGIGRQLLDWRAGTVAAALLWLHPLFARFATRWYPEALGIFLTVAAAYAALRDEGGALWYGLALAALALGIGNHLWEASVALPVTVLYLRRRALARAGGVVAATGLSVGAVEAVQSLQPAGASLVESYSVWNHPGFLLRVDWLFRDELTLATPLEAAVSLTVPLSLVAVAALAVAAIRDPTEPRLLLLSWLVSGLTILVLLPRGWRYHDYYLWALLAPLALSGGLALALAVDRLAAREAVPADAAAELVAVALVCSALFYGAAFELGRTGADRHSEIDWARGEEFRDGGAELAAHDVDDASEVAFVGEWHFDDVPPTYLDRPDVVRVLMYGEVPVEGRKLANASGSPQLVGESATNASECTVAVIRNSSGVHAVPCR